MHEAQDAAAPAVTVVAHDVGPYGGMESQLAELVRRMLDRGTEVTVVCGRGEIAAHPGLTIVSVPLPQRPFPLKYATFFALGTWAVARHRRGAVYTMGAISFNRADARKVPFCHVAWAAQDHKRSRASRNSLPFRINSAISSAMSRAAERLLYRRALTGDLVAMSNGDAAELERYFPSMRPVWVIPNGVDTQRFRPDPAARAGTRAELVPGGGLLAAFVGGDWDRKGLPQAIEALAAAPNWTLAVAGDGDGAAMQALARRHGVADRLRLLGRIPDPERLLAGADALAQPSVYEPWGNAVLEALACGVPAIVTATAGVRDFVADGENGFVVEADASAVASALRRLEDADLRERMGVAGWKTASDYGFGRVADDYLALLTGSQGDSRLRSSAAAV